MIKLDSRECFALETYSSANYFATLCDTWGTLVSHLESVLDRYMLHLPLDYRARELPKQPDIVWGDRIIPNFKRTHQGLTDGLIRLSHGDMTGLSEAHGVAADFKGQMEFWAGWMSKGDEELYRNLLSKCVNLASNICATVEAWWDPGNLTDPEIIKGTFAVPAPPPGYSLDPATSTSTGKQVPIAGIYAPTIEGGCPQFLLAGKSAPRASTIIGRNPLIHPTTREIYCFEDVYDSSESDWIFVRRSTAKELAAELSSGNRVLAGEPCPHTGYYFTPSSLTSRRKFRQGDIMPSGDSQYGVTVWQWDSNQE